MTQKARALRPVVVATRIHREMTSAKAGASSSELSGQIRLYARAVILRGSRMAFRCVEQSRLRLECPVHAQATGSNKRHHQSGAPHLPHEISKSDRRFHR